MQSDLMAVSDNHIPITPIGNPLITRKSINSSDLDPRYEIEDPSVLDDRRLVANIALISSKKASMAASCA